MAGSVQGYCCQVIDPVPENSLCNHCNLLARKLTFTSCCGESYCHAFITITQEEGKPCPACGLENFNTVILPKHQKQIEALQVYCSKKSLGCEWTGSLGKLDSHLDPDMDKCQYVDTKCPLNCLLAIPKNKVEQHVAQECSKRPHVCQHCGFKATYEEVVDIHLPECKYVPLQCPNFCGVSCEREDMEDHLKMCRLEEVDCDFSGVGCQERFVREQEDGHFQEHSQNHLSLTAARVVRLSKEVEPKLQEQEITIKHLKEIVHKQQQELKELKDKLNEAEENRIADKKEMEKQCSSVREEMEQKQKSLVTKLQQDQAKRMWLIWKGISTGTDKRFEIDQYSKEKAEQKTYDFKSPSMHTHINGYKYCLGVSMSEENKEDNISFYVYAMNGRGDDTLKWPAWIKFTVEILNHKNYQNASTTLVFSKWDRPAAGRMVPREPDNLCKTTIKLSNVEDYLLNDTMFFYVSDVVVLSS